MLDEATKPGGLAVTDYTVSVGPIFCLRRIYIESIIMCTFKCLKVHVDTN